MVQREYITLVFILLAFVTSYIMIINNDVTGFGDVKRQHLSNPAIRGGCHVSLPHVDVLSFVHCCARICELDYHSWAGHVIHFKRQTCTPARVIGIQVGITCHILILHFALFCASVWFNIHSSYIIFRFIIHCIAVMRLAILLPNCYYRMNIEYNTDYLASWDW